MKLLLGTDSEVFLLDEKGPVSGHEIVPGSKAKPKRFKHGFIQADGTALEFNSIPAGNPAQFALNVSRIMAEARAFIPRNFRLVARPSVQFEKSYFETLPYKAKELGCDPDYSASNEGTLKAAPRDPGLIRTGAGHLHLGWGSGLDVTSRSHMWDCCAVVNSLESTLGVYEHVWNLDRQRRRFYGDAGAFRPKPYGVEWRGPSNAWVSHRTLYPWIFQVCRFVMDQTERGYAPSRNRGAYAFEAIEDIRAAKGVVDKRGIANNYMARYYGEYFPLMPPASVNAVAREHTRKRYLDGDTLPQPS